MKEIKKPWMKDKIQVLRELRVDQERGLSTEEAENRLKEYGENLLKEEKEIKFFRVFIHEVSEPMILLLLVVGILYSIFGDFGDALTIFAIISILIFVEIYNEYRAKKTIQELKKMASPLISMIRDGRYQEIESKKVVPGDIIILKVGQTLPADIRLLESYGLQVNESILTGESVPITKHADVILKEFTRLTERTNIIFAGTTITRGKGLGVVIATGMNTELGHIAGLTREIKEPKTPLQIAMKQLSMMLVWIALFFSLLIPVIGMIQGRDLIEMLLVGLSLSFATIPEELPILIMIVLALGALILSKKKALVKNLKAAETLGSVTVIATDKTGTLTENRMELDACYTNGKLSPFNLNILSETLRKILEIGMLVHDVIMKKENSKTILVGDPMEIALIEAGKQANISENELKQEYSLITEFSFDNERMMMSQIYKYKQEYMVLVKGALEPILERSIKIKINETEISLSEVEKDKILQIANEMAQEGLRILAFAYKTTNSKDLKLQEAENDLIFLGIIGFLDPPREEVKEAIKKCLDAGIKVFMITGDYEITAVSIAEKIGMKKDGVISGKTLTVMDDMELKNKITSTNIFARITPEQKLRIVNTLKDMGEIVAVTGDGINDAPALKKADIGIAMGLTGTDVARETADMVLLDDNFATITVAIEEGRKLFENLRKGVRFYLAVKLALITIFLFPIFFTIPFPFAPIQIILLELFMDLGASATFVIEIPESDVMKRPPREPSEKFINRKMKREILSGGLMLAAAVIFVYSIAYFQGLQGAGAMAFATWMICHVLLAFNMRTDNDPLSKVGLLSNKMMIFWAIGAFLTTILIIYIPPLAKVFRLSPLSLSDWGYVIIISIIATFWKEIVKIIKIRKNKR